VPTSKQYVFLALTLLCNVAQAEFYVCTDGLGRSIVGESPPEQCKDRDIQVFNADHTFNRVIPAPLTPEQRHAQDAADQARAHKYAEDHEWCRKYPDSLRCASEPRQWCRKHPESSECRDGGLSIDATGNSPKLGEQEPAKPK